MWNFHFFFKCCCSYVCIVIFFYTFNGFLAWALFSVRGFALTSRLFPIRFEAKARSETFITGAPMLYFIFLLPHYLCHTYAMHIANAPISFLSDSNTYGRFLFQLINLDTLFAHMNWFQKARTHTYTFTRPNETNGRIENKLKCQKKTGINFVKLSRFNRASPLSDRNQWFMMRSRGLTIDSRCLSDQWNWLLASQKKTATIAMMKIQTKCTHNSVGRNELE